MRVPFGECHCGCGRKAPLARQSNTERGWVRGQPIRFIHGHHAFKHPQTYSIEDRGYPFGPCWIWQGDVGTTGYAKIGNSEYGHVVFYERKHGPIPEGLELDHLCRLRCCVNPDHTEPVTHTVNVRRGLRAKLSPAAVAEIKVLRDSGLSYASIAPRFGVGPDCISRAYRGKRWKEAA